AEPPVATRPAEPAAQLETAFDQARRMTVPVSIDGHGPFQFVVDTGANRSVVSAEIATRLKLTEAGRAPVHGIAGVEPATLYKVSRMRVGSAFSSRLELPSLPAAKLGADGLLGVDVLHNRRVTLDFVSNRFEIATSARGASIGPGHDTRLGESGPQIVSVPARYRFGQLVIVGAQVAEVPVAAFLDSGSQISVGNLALRDAVLRQRPELAERFVEVPLISATGQVARGELALLPSLRLGTLKLQRMVAVFADLHIFRLWELEDRPSILIGIDVLRQFENVVLDFGRREVIFQAPPARSRQS
ncbi:MAG TPA: aspartyl protease family protein, partial [Phenylobacterium sp.]|nr:aspartyl protease family protein [Phenylobacterium sp.]